MKEKKKHGEYITNFSPRKKENEFTINGKHLIVNDLKMIYFFNKAELFCSDYYYKSEDGLSEFVKLFQCPQKAIFSFVDIKNYQTFKYFVSLINQVGSSSYKEIQNKFQCVEISDICNLFLSLAGSVLVTSVDFGMNFTFNFYFKIYLKLKKDKQEAFNELEKDFILHTPIYCKYMKELLKTTFDEKRSEILLSKKKEREPRESSNKNEVFNALKELESIMKISPEEQKINKIIDDAIATHESQIDEIIKRKHFWTEEEIDSIISNYKEVLYEIYFKEIQEISENNEIDWTDLYQKYFHALDSRLYSQDFKIKMKFESHLEEIKLKETVKEKNIQDEIKMNSNYMLKETENIRDLTVAVDINDNLKSYIKQDF